MLKDDGSSGSGLSDTVFIDQVLLLSPCVRWFKGNFGVDVAPTYTMLPEKSALFQNVGIRAGILYQFKMENK